MPNSLLQLSILCPELAPSLAYSWQQGTRLSARPPCPRAQEFCDCGPVMTEDEYHTPLDAEVLFIGVRAASTSTLRASIDFSARSPLAEHSFAARSPFVSVTNLSRSPSWPNVRWRCTTGSHPERW